ncbi:MULTISPECIES: hypothetical protein [Mesonia]|uniref:Uncharacterized protein n=1 Tax=Mesonia oceanica TaxID=2687242 RepID=A0AC61Y659_9FLAO|nr:MULTISPECIES: hypothetical protein [Mesonia]VVU99956.1 hypothetical protein FVB9532_01218 [Mesonia oceanica]|tara:strand:- start:228 stop:428 length:201 start_codon:yes stop_codon:yes gene_type:complete
MNTKKQLFSSLFILLGAVLLIYGMIAENTNVYIKIVGIIVLMFGLYSSTRVWVEDNKQDNEKDDEI